MMKTITDFGQIQERLPRTRGAEIDGALMVDALLLSMGVLVVILSFLASVSTGEATWFSRSGSLLVLCAAIVQYRYAVHRLGITAALPTMKCAGTAASSRLQKMCGRLSFLAVVMGTLVWGYGDLIFTAI